MHQFALRRYRRAFSWHEPDRYVVLQWPLDHLHPLLGNFGRNQPFSPKSFSFSERFEASMRQTFKFSCRSSVAGKYFESTNSVFRPENFEKLRAQNEMELTIASGRDTMSGDLYRPRAPFTVPLAEPGMLSLEHTTLISPLSRTVTTNGISNLESIIPTGNSSDSIVAIIVGDKCSMTRAVQGSGKG